MSRFVINFIISGLRAENGGGSYERKTPSPTGYKGEHPDHNKDITPEEDDIIHKVIVYFLKFK